MGVGALVFAREFRDVVLLSGGLDSATLLARQVAAGGVGLAVVVDYGQRHVCEVDAARKLAECYSLPVEVLDLRSWGCGLVGSALTDPSVPVPYGHWADESMRATVVPNRNATLLMAACGVALARGCNRVLTAVHAGDFAVYPDCRPEFIDAINYAVGLATDEAVGVAAPFVNLTKTDIARMAHELGVPVGLTWSCYEGGAAHCGRCGACVERREALAAAGVADPVVYASVAA